MTHEGHPRRLSIDRNDIIRSATIARLGADIFPMNGIVATVTDAWAAVVASPFR